MVPDKKDPRWRELVSGRKPVQFTGLATKIFFTRVKLVAAKPDSLDEAVTMAHDFFTKNAAVAAADLKLAFG